MGSNHLPALPSFTGAKQAECFQSQLIKQPLHPGRANSSSLHQLQREFISPTAGRIAGCPAWPPATSPPLELSPPGPVLPSPPRGWQRTHGLIAPNPGGRWHHHALVVTNNFTSPVLFSAEINLQCLMSQNRNIQWLLLSFSIFAASWLTLKSNYCSLFGGTCLLSNGHIAGLLCQLQALMELQIAAATLTDSPA